ncbi:MAG: gliding motility lipoprotein GldH [Bacteroidales bacterium]|jgi:gliding motility-associated lipoprotein GldH|nr:gliding motility lipoprotein GldH [Bacteroidales bacterium]
MKQFASIPAIIWLVVFGIFMQSCDLQNIYEDNVRIPKDGWHQKEMVKFNVDINDTISECNIYINVRNNSKYKWMELWLFVNTHSPQGLSQRDTLKIMLADDHGKWLGHGLGDKFDTRLLYQQNIRFPVSGTYTFEYEQAMRDELLIGIDDIGLRIEKSKK